MKYLAFFVWILGYSFSFAASDLSTCMKFASENWSQKAHFSVNGTKYTALYDGTAIVSDVAGSKLISCSDTLDRVKNDACLKPRKHLNVATGKRENVPPADEAKSKAALKHLLMQMLEKRGFGNHQYKEKWSPIVEQNKVFLDDLHTSGCVRYLTGKNETAGFICSHPVRLGAEQLKWNIFLRTRPKELVEEKKISLDEAKEKVEAHYQNQMRLEEDACLDGMKGSISGDASANGSTQ